MNLMPWRKKDWEDQGTATHELARSSPFGLRTELDRLFDRFFSRDWDFPLASPAWGPALDATEDDKEVTVCAEIPGVDPKDIDVSISGRVLTISGEKKEETEKKGKGFYRSERRLGSFRRSMHLPPYVRTDDVNAEYKNGVLIVHLLKDESAQSKRVPVKAEA